jgi:GNAT superfamily N-acetyltransferase
MNQSRPAIPDDLPAIHAVWWAADPAEASRHNPWFGHVLRTGTMMVATVEAEVIGFAGVRQVGGTLVVSDCFVHPQHQGNGVGTALLDQLIAIARPVMTFASSDPKAGSLYTRFGMTAKWKCHYLTGDPRRLEGVGRRPSHVERYPISESDLVHLRDDLSCRFLESGSSAAAVSAKAIESSRIVRGIGGARQLKDVLAWMADRGDETVAIHLAEQHPVFPALVEAGFQITAADTLMASEGAEVPDPTMLTFNGDILRIGR